MNEERLTKSDLCWVLVKLAGAVLVLYAVFVLYGAMVMYLAMDVPLGNSPTKLVFLTILMPLGLGIHLLVSGWTLHGLLMAVPNAGGEKMEATNVGGKSEKPRERPTTKPKKRSTRELSLAQRRLSEEEFEKYQKWVEGNPEVMRRNEVDRLALFRDAQKSGKV